MNEYRCTRTTPNGNLYPANSAAYTSLLNRQGHYIRVEAKGDEAEELILNQLAARFPKDMKGKSLRDTFTISLWKENTESVPTHYIGHTLSEPRNEG